MPIQMIEDKPEFPILGKIRLGVRKESSSGAQYPTSTEYFVLDDAPGVAEVYGDDPKALDIIFPGDDLNQIIPTWLKMYSAGKKGSNGDLIGGKLNCKGDGPREDTVNGEKVVTPGTAIHYALRDPVTRVAPTRPCLGEACPDWLDSKGNPKCKQMMKVICVLPRVSWLGGFVIDTSSWGSIKSFHNQLRYIKKLNNGSVMGIPFQIYREETAMTYYDTKSQTEKNSVQYIMKLRPYEKLLELHGGQIKEKMGIMKGMQYSLEGTQEKLLMAPMEDHFPTYDAEHTDSTTPAEAPKQTAEALLEDADIKAAFSRLEKTMGKVFPPKSRLIAIRKKEQEPDIKKAVLQEIDLKVQQLQTSASQAPKGPEPVAPPEMAEEPESGSGIL